MVVAPVAVIFVAEGVGYSKVGGLGATHTPWSTPSPLVTGQLSAASGLSQTS